MSMIEAIREALAEGVAVPVNYVSLWLQRHDPQFWSDVIETLMALGVI